MAEAIVADAGASGIYQIRNTVNGKRYIGSAKCIRRRWYAHTWAFANGRHSNRLLQRSWSKYGEQAFAFEVIETCAIGELIVREQYWIDTVRPEYNLSPTAGNCLGVKHSDEARRKVSERNRGNKYSLGREMTQSTRRKISEANKGKLKGIRQRPEQVAARAALHTGMRRSAETRRRISESRKGKKLTVPRSAEYRAKMSALHKGKHKSPEQMAALQAGRLAHRDTDEQRAAKSRALFLAYESGRRSRVKSEEHKNKIGQFYAKLTDAQVREIRQLKSAGATGRFLAEKYASSAGTISAICRGKRYRWVA